MRSIALIALLSTAGFVACNKSPLDPSQTGGVAGTSSNSTGSSAGSGTAAAPDSVAADSSGDCVQTGENQGQCGSQGADSTESPGSESETPDVEALRT